MSIQVEVSLRIPSVKNPMMDENGYPLDHASIRFITSITVPAIPKPGTTLQLSTSSGKTFSCDVVRADWSEDKELFVVSCKYSNRSIPPDEYGALVNDADWRMRPLI
jgi:hypothetical protein